MKNCGLFSFTTPRTPLNDAQPARFPFATLGQLALIGAYFAMTKVFKMLTDPLKQVPGDWRFLRLLIVVCAILTIAFSALDYSTRCLESIVEHWPF